MFVFYAMKCVITEPALRNPAYATVCVIIFSYKFRCKYSSAFHWSIYKITLISYVSQPLLSHSIVIYSQDVVFHCNGFKAEIVIELETCRTF